MSRDRCSENIKRTILRILSTEPKKKLYSRECANCFENNRTQSVASCRASCRVKYSNKHSANTKETHSPNCQKMRGPYTHSFKSTRYYVHECVLYAICRHIRMYRWSTTRARDRTYDTYTDMRLMRERDREHTSHPRTHCAGTRARKLWQCQIPTIQS